mmetsp:Transcript_19231/g.66017  ORF Transcript_19231/g.66017 Transcript_19231/m.66017 type:complete len:285 (+) Transcript_19231:615-1469(+)
MTSSCASGAASTWSSLSLWNARLRLRQPPVARLARGAAGEAGAVGRRALASHRRGDGGAAPDCCRVRLGRGAERARLDARPALRTGRRRRGKLTRGAPGHAGEALQGGRGADAARGSRRARATKVDLPRDAEPLRQDDGPTRQVPQGVRRQVGDAREARSAHRRLGDGRAPRGLPATAADEIPRRRRRRGPRRDRRRLRKRQGLPSRDGTPRLWAWRHRAHRAGRRAVQPRRRRPGGPRQNDRDVQSARHAPRRGVWPRRGTTRRGPASRGPASRSTAAKPTKT